MRFGRRISIAPLLLLLGFLCSHIENVNGDYDSDAEAPLKIADCIPVHISSIDEDSDIQPVALEGGGRQYTLRNTGSSYISVHFANLDLDPSCSFEITDENGGQSTIMHGRGRENLGTFWAHHVEGDTMILTLQCSGPHHKADFLINEYAAGYPDGHPATDDRKLGVRGGRRGRSEMPFHEQQRDLTICTENDMRNAKCYQSSHPTEYNKAMAVARLIVNGMFGCTGWLVGSNNLLLTNWHCINSLDAAMNTDYQFMFESADCETNTVVGSINSFDAINLLAYNSTKDYSLIQLSGNPAAEFGYLDIEEELPSVGEKIFIPQHAGARDKEIGIFDTSLGPDERCEVMSTTASDCRGEGAYNDVSYSCDTEGGSSGSPVLSVESGKVIALHHCGGGCNGNRGVPMAEIYDEIAPFVYPSSSTPNPTTVPSPAPTMSSSSSSPTFESSESPTTAPSDDYDYAILIQQTGETEFPVTPIVILDPNGDSVLFRVTNTFSDTVARIFTTYKSLGEDYVCYEEQDVAPGSSFDLTAACLHHQPLSIVQLYVWDPNLLIPNEDNATIHECCHAPANDTPVVQYTFQLDCGDSSTG